MNPSSLARKSSAPIRASRPWLALGATLLLVTACGGGGSSTDNWPALKTIDATAMQQAVSTRAAQLLVPGAVVIVRTPKGDFTSSYGVTTYKGSTPTKSDLHMRIGSLTKTWTGTVILQEVQEGLLKLSDPVSKFRAGVPKGDQITIEQLLAMRTGLFNYSTTVEFNQALDDAPQRVWTQDELLAMAFGHPQSFDPGTAWEYSNTNTVLLGLIAETVEKGKPLAAIMQDRLFTPLKLKNTVFPDTTVNTLPAPFSHGYQYGTNVQTLKPLSADMQAAARAGTLLPNDQTFDNPSWGWSAGAGISSANDLVTWVQALVGGNLLNADLQAARLASVQSTTNPAVANAPGYGWAIAKFGPLYGHTGELPGFNTFMGYDPVNKVTVVVWTNLEPTVDGKAAANQIAMDLIGQIYVAP